LHTWCVPCWNKICTSICIQCNLTISSYKYMETILQEVNQCAWKFSVDWCIDHCQFFLTRCMVEFQFCIKLGYGECDFCLLSLDMVSAISVCLFFAWSMLAAIVWDETLGEICIVKVKRSLYY
jgi:hypothetical protein